MHAHSPRRQAAAAISSLRLHSLTPLQSLPLTSQGKVNQLVLQKEAGRLELMKDIAGISTYEERRAEVSKQGSSTAKRSHRGPL